MLFTGKEQTCPGSSWRLGKTICFLLSSLGQGLEKEPEPMLQKCQGETSRSPCSAGCSCCVISCQHRGPWLTVLCLWESPWLWKTQEIDPVVTQVYRVVMGLGKHGRLWGQRRRLKPCNDVGMMGHIIQPVCPRSRCLCEVA